jgi:hypothetical protein
VHRRASPHAPRVRVLLSSGGPTRCSATEARVASRPRPHCFFLFLGIRQVSPLLLKNRIHEYSVHGVSLVLALTQTPEDRVDKLGLDASLGGWACVVGGNQASDRLASASQWATQVFSCKVELRVSPAVCGTRRPWTPVCRPRHGCVAVRNCSRARADVGVPSLSGSRGPQAAPGASPCFSMGRHGLSLYIVGCPRSCTYSPRHRIGAPPTGRCCSVFAWPVFLSRGRQPRPLSDGHVDAGPVLGILGYRGSRIQGRGLPPGAGCRKGGTGALHLLVTQRELVCSRLGAAGLWARQVVPASRPSSSC